MLDVLLAARAAFLEKMAEEQARAAWVSLPIVAPPFPGDEGRDPDGGLVPLPERKVERVVPGFPLSAYRALVD